MPPAYQEDFRVYAFVRSHKCSRGSCLQSSDRDHSGATLVCRLHCHATREAATGEGLQRPGDRAQHARNRESAPLLALCAALPGRLTMMEANLLQDGSFDEVVKGATYVFHTASPFIMGGLTDPQRDLMRSLIWLNLEALLAVLQAIQA